LTLEWNEAMAGNLTDRSEQAGVSHAPRDDLFGDHLIELGDLVVVRMLSHISRALG
jgi:hypothetical protein